MFHIQIAKAGSEPFMYSLSLAGSIYLLGRTEFALQFVSAAALLRKFWLA